MIRILTGFADIDTFFVIDQVVEIQEMFREIEGRLEGSWDLYIKALKQYKEREGDCVIPYNHVESVNDTNVNLGQFCINVRSNQSYLLTNERKECFLYFIQKHLYEV